MTDNKVVDSKFVTNVISDTISLLESIVDMAKDPNNLSALPFHTKQRADLIIATLLAVRLKGVISLDYVLPCSVRIPPKTIFQTGVTLRSLIMGMETFGRPKEFKDEVRKLHPGDHCVCDYMTNDMIMKIVVETETEFTLEHPDGYKIVVPKTSCDFLTPLQYIKMTAQNRDLLD